MIRNAKDLSPDQKMAIESLLGRRVQEHKAISIRAIEPPESWPSEATALQRGNIEDRGRTAIAVSRRV
jgi:hypothetical protein